MMDILSQILDNGSELTTNMQMFLLMTALMFLPTIIFMMTSFVRVIITFSFIKSALGAQQSIPNQILVGLAMCITLFIMSPVMNKVAENSIRPYMNQEITMQEGHTDNIPISSGTYKSNWELSTARAITVLRYFIETKGFDPTRFSATGYGEYKPLVDNSTEENRAINRRVDILIVQQKEK